MAIYVDDIVSIGSDYGGIQQRHGNILSQRKYVFDPQKEIGMIGCKLADTPIEPNVKLCVGIGSDVDVGCFQQLVGKLIYITVTIPDMSYSVSVISQYMHKLQQSHSSIGKKILLL
ncbi:uncharacterized mitochondrial protein AtMg00810-like [Aristolochia californica]|uniref:uncharacterized mitochondrial protein AtMg00810-like n=1 Tax=Aristolochia californica TaxID=171875 RepID=UPI0035D53C86